MDKLYGGDSGNTGAGSGSRGGFRGGHRGGRGGFRGGGIPKGGRDFGYKPEDMNVVKIRGLPYHIRYEEVSEFFKDFKYVEQSVVFGLNYEGRKNGFGAILFEDDDQAAAAAKEMNKKYISTSNRYVDLSVISYEDYLNFNTNAVKEKGRSGGHWGGSSGSYVKLYQCVNKENLDRSLILRGLPYKISTLQIQNFLNGYGTIPAENIFIEEFDGKRSGSALVVFENDQVAQDAKGSL
jgi:RNA recognition motif-containing protein